MLQRARKFICNFGGDGKHLGAENSSGEGVLLPHASPIVLSLLHTTADKARDQFTIIDRPSPLSPIRSSSARVFLAFFFFRCLFRLMPRFLVASIRQDPGLVDPREGIREPINLSLAGCYATRVRGTLKPCGRVVYVLKFLSCQAGFGSNLSTAT